MTWHFYATHFRGKLGTLLMLFVDQLKWTVDDSSKYIDHKNANM